MKIGSYRHRVEFQENKGTEQDAYGQPQTVWKTYARRWARITPQDGSEKVEGGKPQASVRFLVWCRAPVEGINPAHRVRFRGRTLEIVAVLNLQELDRELRLECVEKIEPS